MTSLCIISTELPPTKTFATTADEANENIIQVFKKLNFKLFYVFIDEDRHYKTQIEKAIGLNAKIRSSFIHYRKKFNFNY